MHWGMLGGLQGGGGPPPGARGSKIIRLALGRVKGVPSREPESIRLALGEGVAGGCKTSHVNSKSSSAPPPADLSR